MSTREFANHELDLREFVCPVTGEIAEITWTDYEKNSTDGIGNSCVHCSGRKPPRKGYFFGRFYINQTSASWDVDTSNSWGCTLAKFETEIEARDWAAQETERLNQRNHGIKVAREAKNQRDCIRNHETRKKNKRQMEIDAAQMRAREYGCTSCWPSPSECCPLSKVDQDEIDRLFPGV